MRHKLNNHQPSKELMTLRNIGPRMAERLEEIGIHTVSQFRQHTPDELYERLNEFLGYREDRCVLYIFRGAWDNIPWPLCSDKNFGHGSKLFTTGLQKTQGNYNLLNPPLLRRTSP